MPHEAATQGADEYPRPEKMEHPMYTLYGGGFTRAHMTEMVLTEIGQPYHLIEVDTENGAHPTPDYLKINPAGWVPALITPEGKTLCETHAINLYLADKHGPGWLSPPPDDPDRGLFLSALFYLAGELEPALKRYFYPHRYTLRQGDATAARQQALKHVGTCLKVINQRLEANGPYHLGTRYSLVDLGLSYWMLSIMNPADVAGFEAIDHCVSLVTTRPGLTHLFDDLRQRTKDWAKLDKRDG